MEIQFHNKKGKKEREMYKSKKKNTYMIILFYYRLNELLRIEEELGENAIYAGEHFHNAHNL